METTMLQVSSEELTAQSAWGISIIERDEEMFLVGLRMFAEQLVEAYEAPYPLTGVRVAPEDHARVREEVAEVQMDRGAPWPTVARYLGI